MDILEHKRACGFLNKQMMYPVLFLRQSSKCARNEDAKRHPCNDLCTKYTFKQLQSPAVNSAEKYTFKQLQDMCLQKKARCTTIVEWQKETDHRPGNEESNQGCGLQGYRLLKHLNPLSRHDGRGLSSGAVVITPCIHNVG